MASTHMIVDPGHEDDIFGIAISSPGMYSPGLAGEQGWSPCSSVYDESFDRDTSRRNKRDLAATLVRARRHTMAWPVPPIRVPATRPLSFTKDRQGPAMRQRPSSSASSSGSSAMSESSAATIPDGVALPHASPLIVMKGKHLSGARRYVSMPAKVSANVDLLETILDDVRVVHGNGEHDFDETLPLMPEQHLADWHDVDEEEQIKMERLQASFSLLGVERGPRAGYYSPTSSSGSRNESECSSPAGVTGHSVKSSPVDGDAGHSPTSGLCLLRMALSPEHKAPTLAEQMAFATGLGAMCAWASPMRSSYAAYSPRDMPALQAVRSVAQSASLTTVDQHERQHASRHIRQGVAASAALTRSQSIEDSIYQEAVDYEDIVEERGLEASHCGQAVFERYVRSSTPTLYSVGHHSIAASTVISASSSPIMHGALSASTFGTTAEVMATAAAVPAHAVMQTDSPILQDEFSYLAHNDAFLASLQEEGQRPIVVNTHKNAYWPDATGFNGNTLSPCLTTPELGMRSTPSPMHGGPSPYLSDASISGIAPVETDEQYDTSLSFTSAPPMLPSSSSMSSVLQRPRPIASSRSASCFSHSDVMFDHHREVKRAGRPVKPVETSKETGAATPPCIPTRKASLDLDTLVKLQSPPATVRASVSFKDDPHPRHMLQVAHATSTTSLPAASTASSPMRLMATSMSTGSLGPKALTQVREACRIKAVYLRNGKSLNVNDENTESIPPVPLVPAALRSNPTTPIKATSSSISASSVDVVQVSKPSLPSKSNKRAVATASPEDVRMPTLFVARTPSQRKRGATGIPATEPRNIAMAKMGMPITTPTRSSTVQALSRLDSAMADVFAATSSSGNSGSERRRSSCFTNAAAQSPPPDCSVEVLDPALAIEAHMRSSLDNMPDGFVLVVEQKETVVSHVNGAVMPI